MAAGSRADCSAPRLLLRYCKMARKTMKPVQHSHTLALKEFITVEELIWLFTGLAFGFLLGKGFSFMLLAIPLAAFLIAAFWYFERRSLY